MNEELGRQMAQEVFGLSPDAARSACAAPDVIMHARYAGPLSAQEYLGAGYDGVSTRNVAWQLCGGVAVSEAQRRPTMNTVPSVPHTVWNPQGLTRTSQCTFSNLPLPGERQCLFDELAQDAPTEDAPTEDNPDGV